MLGVVIRNSAGAIVAYFVYTLVLPPLLGLLAMNQQWFADLQPWVDYNYAQTVLFNGSVTSRAVAAARGLRDLLVPPAAGRRPVHRPPRPRSSDRTPDLNRGDATVPSLARPPS